MKKIVILIFMLLSLFVISPTDYQAETTDNTAPTIENYSFDKSDYNIGDNITIDITAYDDVSGVQYVNVVFVDPTKDYHHDLNASFGLMFNLEHEGREKYTVQIPVFVKEGNYKLRYLEICDKEQNVAYYKAFQDDNHIGTPASRQESIAGMSIKITNTKNYSYPEIESFKINKTSFEVGDEVIFEVILKDNRETEMVLINYSNIGYLTLNREENSNKYIGTYKVTSPGDYKFNILHIKDKNQMESGYTYKNDTSEQQSAKSFKIFEPGTYDFKVTGERDTIPPVLESIKFEKNEYIAPSVVKVYLGVNDNLKNNIKEVEISFYKPNEDKHSILGYPCIEDKDNNNFVCKMDFNQYAVLGEYELNNIIIRDKSGNTSMYSAEHYQYTEYDKVLINDDGTASINKKTEKQSFFLKEDLSSNVTTSTIAQDLLEKIKKSTKDATISIDTTKNSIVKKEVFDLIKGTNRTLYLEAEGIVWEVKGKNIVLTKDIDTKVTLCLLNECNDDYKKYLASFLKKGLVIEFQNNGLLPAITKIRIKADYAFRNYIGTSNLKLYFDTNTLFDLIASGVKMKEDGYYEFYINHNSVYVLTNEEIKQDFVGEDKKEELGNDKLQKEEIEKEPSENEESQKPQTEDKESIEQTKDDTDIEYPENEDNENIGQKEEQNQEGLSEKENQNKNDNKLFAKIIVVVLMSVIFGLVFIKVFKLKLKKKKK